MNLLLPILLFVIAAGYAAVGLGGGSAYLAVFSFWSRDPQVIRPLAWGLNILVAGVGFINYYRAGHYSAGFSTPLIIGGIAGGAVGARLPITTEVFSWLLAVTLFLVAGRMLLGIKTDRLSGTTGRPRWILYIIAGFICGVISGLIGIGGGIVLGPIMLVFRQAGMKTSAAMTSLYVALTSAGAMAAFLLGGGTIDAVQLPTYGVLCVLGGYLGSRFGARKASPRLLECIFGVFVLIAAVRLAVINL